MSKLKIKLPASWMETLETAYVTQSLIFKAQDDHEHLLLEHVNELLGRISAQLVNHQGKYTLSFSGTEAMAFMQFWMLVPMEVGSHIQVVVQHIIQTIDKRAADSKVHHRIAQKRLSRGPGCSI